jgi:hypothetical protein
MRSLWAPAEPGRFRPGRVAVVVAIAVALTLALATVFPDAGFVGALVLVVSVPLAVIATPRAIGMWRGTVPHTVITHVPPRWYGSLESYQAFGPCAIIAMDGIIVSFAVLVTTGGDGPVAQILGFGGALVFLVFMAAAFCAGVTRRPRFLLPATMRAGRSS